MLFQSMSAIPAIKYGISNTYLIVQLIYSLEDFCMDLVKYSIRIKNVPSSDSSRMIESIIGYRFNN